VSIPNPICWLRTVLRTFFTGVWIHGDHVSGHSGVLESRLSNCIVTVLRCADCGKVDVSWESTARSTDEPYPDQKRRGLNSGSVAANGGGAQ